MLDPAEPSQILKFVMENNLRVSSILTTHHHWDHSGGNKTLVRKLGIPRVYGGIPYKNLNLKVMIEFHAQPIL